MAESIKFTDKYIDTTGVYDSTLNKTQQVINSKLVTVDTSSSSIGTPNPVNADTFGGYALSNFVRTSQLVNNFTTATAGLYALDAAAGKTLNDSLQQISTELGRYGLASVTDITFGYDNANNRLFFKFHTAVANFGYQLNISLASNTLEMWEYNNSSWTRLWTK